MDQGVTFDRALIARYDVNGPRYTSYPTALQFGDVTTDPVPELAAVSPFRDRDLSVYCHIPFCATLCYYCACNKIVTRRLEPAAEYVDLLKREIGLREPLFRGRRVAQLHFGGGTPTFLSDEQLFHLMQTIDGAYPFLPEGEREFSIEIDPRTVDEARIRALRAAGFNRLSLGIQDFDPDVQRAVNRVQSFEDTRGVIAAARRHGFRSVSVDLIYGLPKQTLATFGETLDKVAGLAPDRVSVYNYAHLPDRFSPQRRILHDDLPTPDEKLRLLECTINRLTGAGYAYIGMDHFARPDDELAVAQREGTLQRNFQGYSTHADRDLVAFGVSAISHVGHGYVQNAKDLETYRERLGAGRPPVEKALAVEPEDRLRAAVISALICHFELDFAVISTRFGIDFERHFADELARLDDFVADGLVARTPAGLEVTREGRLFVRNVCMVFDRHVAAGAARQRYSRVI